MANSATNVRKQEFAYERKARRVDYGQAAVFKPNHRSNQTGFVRDVSEQGVFLITQEPLTMGTEILFYLPMQLGPRAKKVLCMVSGAVVRIDGRFSGPLRGYGVQFSGKLSQVTLRQLREFVASHLTALQ
ncbi:MAG TPA: PilZ domain-containing protein [Bdellovibrionota bacterium]|nr:PilZ domain-containing protein [Bdellovibrionota bacterium]